MCILCVHKGHLVNPSMVSGFYPGVLLGRITIHELVLGDQIRQFLGHSCHSDGLKGEQVTETVVDGAFFQLCTFLPGALRVSKVQLHRSVCLVGACKHEISKSLGVHLRVESVRARSIKFVYTNLHCCICGERCRKPFLLIGGNGLAFS